MCAAHPGAGVNATTTLPGAPADISTGSSLLADLGKVMAGVVARCLPLIGSGAERSRDLDAVATRELEMQLIKWSDRRHIDLALGRAEGERDGSPSLSLEGAHQEGAHQEGAPTWHVYSDPVDGTLCGVSGEPRCCSALALDKAKPPRLVRDLPDSTSIFFVGSNFHDVVPDLSDVRESLESVALACRERDGLFGSLNRPDNRQLVEDVFGLHRPRNVTACKTGHAETIFSDGVVLVGDSTVTLPLEADAGFGRIGFVEAIIESALWRNWVGLVMSKGAMAEWPGGPMSYLDSYARAIKAGTATVDNFFTPVECVLIKSSNLESVVLGPLSRESLGRSDETVTLIAGITGSACPEIDYPWRWSLPRASLDEAGNVTVPVTYVSGLRNSHSPSEEKWQLDTTVEITAGTTI
jgi:hypothetical protein